MFAAEVLQKHIRPRGMKFEVVEIVDPPAPVANVVGVTSYEQDRKFYKGTVEGYGVGEMWLKADVEFSLPIPNQNGIFEINGSRRYIVQEGIIDLPRCEFGKPIEFFFRSRTKVLLMALNGIFNGAFMEFFMRGQPPTSMELQTAIDSWFKSSPMTQDVPESPIAASSLKDLVYLRVERRGLEVDERRFSPRLWNKIDPSSTPQGEKVNVAYRLVDGAKIEGSNIVPGKSIFCSTTQRYGIAGALSPRRLHLVRAGIEHSMPLVEYETPLVGAAGPSGRHLRTAIMHFRAHAGEDAIVMSETASKKLTAIRHYREQVWSLGEIHMKVAEGDAVAPGQLLAEVMDPLDGTKSEVHSKKAKYPGVIERLRAVRSEISGIKAVRIDITIKCEIPVESGDKVYTRAAVKGVVRVVPDEQMPVTPNGRVIEAIISPESVVGRRAMLVYWEMMANQYALKTKKPVIADHLVQSPTFKELVDMGYGDGVQLSLNGEQLEQQTYVGYTFFMRTDKLAREMLSAHNEDVTLNGMRVPVDKARVSGQKRDLAKGLAMLARGLRMNFTHSLIVNMHGQHAFRELARVLGVEPEKTGE